MDKNTTLGVGQTAITDDGVFWIEDADGTDTGQAAVRRADLDGTNAVTVTPEAGDGSLHAYSVTASDDAVTVTTLPPATTWANDTLPKLFQVSPDGKGAHSACPATAVTRCSARPTRATGCCGSTARPAGRTS